VAARAPLGAAAARDPPRARPAAARTADDRRPDRPRDDPGCARRLGRRRRRRVPARLPHATRPCRLLRGRAQHIYLEDPDTFWTRLRELQSEALFVWGRQDRIVPIGFARHVRGALPGAEHLELDCGHVPQLEAPRSTHAALLEFLAAAPALTPR